jgi:hypothetical protein
MLRAEQWLVSAFSFRVFLLALGLYSHHTHRDQGDVIHVRKLLLSIFTSSNSYLIFL